MSALQKHGGREMLDAAPLQAVIRRDAQIALADAPQESTHGDTHGLYFLADQIGIDGKILMRVMSQERVSFDLADRYCCAANRLLRDLYPDVYDEQLESITTICKKCRIEVDHDVLAEWHLRMHLCCRDCGKRSYLERNKRRLPRTAFKPRDVDDAAIVAAYLAGASAREVAERFGFASDKSILQRVRDAGEPVRGHANEHTIAVGSQNLARGRRLRIQQGEETIRRLTELWMTGAKVREIAAELGLSESHILTVRQRRGLPKRRPGGRGWA